MTFNGVAATIKKDNATKIKVTVPAGATSGDIEVTDPGGIGHLHRELHGHLAAGPLSVRLVLRCSTTFGITEIA